MRRILFVFLLAMLSGCEQPPPTALANGETLEGVFVEDGKVAAFLGVPFAAPPVGELRWRGPQPLATKVELRKATAFAPACMQKMRILDWYRDMAELFGGSRDYYDDLEVSEDCLYLNVWTPALRSDAKLPVMVWVHGGGNDGGWSYELNYHGHKLAQQGVVVVSLAYRVGVFGFLSHRELDPGEPIANFGLWDLVQGLGWISENIARFGGDPQRVTMFGESAGAQNILALIGADPARGLFQRAALQSTAGFGINRVSSVEDEQKRAIELADALDLDNAALANLRAVPADRLLDVYDETFTEYYHSPVIDGQLITEATWQRISAGEVGGRQILIGTNLDEWLDYIDADAGRAELEAASRELVRIDGEAALAIVADEADPRRAMDRLRTAENMLCPSLATARRWTGNNGDAWVYFFTRVREDEGGRRIGAYHGAEYPYIFGIHDDYMTTNATDLALQEAVQSYWLQFAATGDPNSPGTPDWPQFRAPGYPVLELGDAVHTISAPEAELCSLYEKSLADPNNN